MTVAATKWLWIMEEEDTQKTAIWKYLVSFYNEKKKGKDFHKEMCLAK